MAKKNTIKAPTDSHLVHAEKPKPNVCKPRINQTWVKHRKNLGTRNNCAKIQFFLTFFRLTISRCSSSFFIRWRRIHIFSPPSGITDSKPFIPLKHQRLILSYNFSSLKPTNSASVASSPTELSSMIASATPERCCMTGEDEVMNCTSNARSGSEFIIVFRSMRIPLSGRAIVTGGGRLERGRFLSRRLKKQGEGFMARCMSVLLWAGGGSGGATVEDKQVKSLEFFFRNSSQDAVQACDY
jgi:hypothetical protein